MVNLAKILKIDQKSTRIFCQILLMINLKISKIQACQNFKKLIKNRRIFFVEI